MLSKFVGESERKLQELFTTASSTAPSIIFMDEVDGLAPVGELTVGSTCWRVVLV